MIRAIRPKKKPRAPVRGVGRAAVAVAVVRAGRAPTQGVTADLARVRAALSGAPVVAARAVPVGPVGLPVPPVGWRGAVSAG
jgi:hypothetical protein